MLYLIIILFAVAFLTVLFVTPFVRKFAIKKGIVDKPDNKIKTHKEPVAYLGGISLFIGIMISLTVIFILYKTGNKILTKQVLTQITVIILCSSAVMVLGLIDDLKDLSPGLKLLIQALISWIITNFGILIQIKYFPVWFNVLLTVLWLVTMINAANLIDIMDGLCSGVIAVSSFTFIIAGIITFNPSVSILSVIVLGITLAFLKYNFNPAKIFLGDTGSLMLGFITGCISVSLSYTRHNLLGLLVPVVIMGIPLYDTVLLVYFRLKSGKSPIQGSKDHFALRLKFLGFTTRKTVLLIYIISIILSLASVIIIKSGFENAVAVYIMLLLISYVFAVMLSKLNPEKEDE